MNQHTTGPWRAGYESETDRVQKMIVRAEHVDGQPYVAVVPNMDGRHEANATLIAASPDLLAACRGLIDTFVDRVPMIDRYGVIVRARQAIAKATGEQP